MATFANQNNCYSIPCAINRPPVHPIAWHQKKTDNKPGLLARFKNWFNCYLERRRDRDSFATLLRLDDHTLIDIGIKKADLIWASRLPLSVDAATELNNRSNYRKRL